MRKRDCNKGIFLYEERKALLSSTLTFTKVYFYNNLPCLMAFMGQSSQNQNVGSGTLFRWRNGCGNTGLRKNMFLTIVFLGSTRNMEPWIECAVNPKNPKSHFTFSAFGIQLRHHSSPWKLKAWESFLEWTFHHGLSWGCVWSPTPLMSRMVTTRPGWWFCMEMVDVQ